MANELPAQFPSSNEEPAAVSELRQQNAELRKRLSSLVDASSRIGRSLDTNTILGEVIESACSLTTARYGALLTYEEPGVVRDVYASGIPPAGSVSIKESPTGWGLLEHLAEIDGPVRLAGMGSQSESTGNLEDPFPIETFLGMQIRQEGEHLGNIILIDKESGGDFTEEDEETLVMLASQAATAISNAHRYENERRSKADLEALQDISPVAVAVFDAKTGRMVSFNREFKRLAGENLEVETEWEEALPSWSFRHADGREIPISELPMNRVFMFGETVRAEDIVVLLPDGRSISTLVSAAPIYSEQGELVAGMVTVQDMTPMADLERVRSQFLGLVSEDLRLPLATIKGSASALSDIVSSRGDAESRQLLRIIDQQADLMRNQVNSLLELTYIENGTLSISPEAADVEELLNEATREFIRGHTGTEIEADVPVGLPQVMADEQRIGQVLNNLLYSVSRHTTDLSSIKVSAAQFDIYVTISVSANSGVVASGEPRQLVQRMLGSQIQDIRKAAGGESLALAMCKGIVEAHGGRMRVENEDQEGGLLITFTIPAVEEVKEEVVPGDAFGMEGNGSPGNSNGRILLLIDDPRVLGTVRQTLSRAGYTPTSVYDLDGMDRLVGDEKPILILLDLPSNRAGGFQVLQRLSDDYDIPTIVLSGQGDEGNIERAFEMGADDYIVTPFSPTELVARIRASLRKRGISQQVGTPTSYLLRDVAIDYTARTLTVSGDTVHLTATEYDLLVELSTRAGSVVTQNELLQRVWGPEYTGESQLLRSYVKSLRQKLGDKARSPTYIFTEHGTGYRMPKP